MSENEEQPVEEMHEAQAEVARNRQRVSNRSGRNSGDPH